MKKLYQLNNNTYKVINQYINSKTQFYKLRLVKYLFYNISMSFERGFEMDKTFIGERITKLRMAKAISERELSLSLGKAHNYIYSISSGKILPTMKSFLDICDYFEISPSEFFDEERENPLLTRDILKKLYILSEKDLSVLLEITEATEPDFMKSYLEFMDKFRSK